MVTMDEFLKILQDAGYDAEIDSGVVIVYDVKPRKLLREVKKAGYKMSFGTRGRNPKPVALNK